MRKRVLATRPAQTDLNKRTERFDDNGKPQDFLPFLSPVTKGCYVHDVDPKSCIPLHLVRDDSRNAIERLKEILNGTSKCHHLLLSGMFSGTPTSIVVPLEGDLVTFLDEYLSDRFENPEDASAMKAKYPQWFGVVDGCQLRQALHELMDEFPDTWGKFMWKVIVVHPRSSVDQYTQLARVQNERNKKGYTYECTVHDLLRGLRKEYDKLIAEFAKTCATGERGARSKVTHKDVAEMYDGGDHWKQTPVRQAVTVAARITWDSIEAIGTVVNTTCADVIVHSTELNVYSLKSQDEVLANQDCRLFKNFVCFGSLRSAKCFMSAEKDGHGEAQVNCIFRMQHWCELHKYRHVQAKIISEQFDLAKQALIEERNFLSFIKQKEWPSQMATARDNMLRTTLYDSDIKVNRGNDKDVLPSLWKYFRQLFPAKARALEQAASAEGQGNASGAGGADGTTDNPDSQPTDTPPQDEDSGENNDENDAEAQARRNAEEQKRENDRIVSLQKKADTIMGEVGISCLNTSFPDFLQQVWNSSQTRSDMVMCTLPDDTEQDVLRKLPEFCAVVLHPGSYCFVILSENQFSDMFHCFKQKSFKVSPHSFKILYDESTIQRRATTDFPQRHGDIALIAKTEGLHPTKFRPSFDDVVGRFASLSGIKACQDRLRKPTETAPLIPGEKSTDLFAHIIKVFCPLDGLVLDPFASGLTTALACLKTGRRALCIDPSKNSFPYALGRVRVHVVPDATMESYETYSKITTGTTPTDASPTAEPNHREGPEKSCVSVPITPENSARPLKRRRYNVNGIVITDEEDSTIPTDDDETGSHDPAAVQALLTLSS